MNWGKDWFEFYPNPPISVLHVIENILKSYDNELFQHFVQYGVSPQVFNFYFFKII